MLYSINKKGLSPLKPAYILLHNLFFVKGRTCIKTKIISIAEEKLIIYFRDLAEIERLQKKLAFLNNQKLEIDKDIRESRIILENNLQGINYDSSKVQTSYRQSEQEKSIDRAFDRLESELNKINAEIYYTKIYIREIENKTTDLKLILEKLNEDSQRFIKLKYQQNKSYKQIGFHILSSESSIWRMRNLVLCEVGKYIIGDSKLKDY